MDTGYSLMTAADHEFAEKMDVSKYVKNTQHSMRWSKAYDYVNKTYPTLDRDAKRQLITEIVNEAERLYAIKNMGGRR